MVYALALTTLTHLPYLQINPPGDPPRDKILHWLCFGGLTILLWRTRWVKRGWAVVILMLGWAAVDEITQGSLVPGRSFSLLDVVASSLGVISAGFVIAAMRPVGGPVNQLRVRRFEFIVDALLARPRAWLLLLPQALSLALLVGGVVWFSTRWYHGKAEFGASAVAFAVGAIAGALGALAWLFRGALARFSESRTCAHCGASGVNAAVDDTGRGTCPHCGTPFHIGEWTITADLPRPVLSRIFVRSLVPSIVLGVAIIIAYAVLIALYLRWPEFRRLTSGANRTITIISSAIDMTIVSGLGALVLYRFRRGLARVFDEQAEICRACGHDVHATPTQHGLGRCPECGTEFMRMAGAFGTGGHS